MGQWGFWATQLKPECTSGAACGASTGDRGGGGNHHASQYEWRQSPLIMWLEGCSLMASGVDVLNPPWQQEENKWTETVPIYQSARCSTRSALFASLANCRRRRSPTNDK